MLLPTLAAFALHPGSAQWSDTQAQDWGKKQPWLVGCNFYPSTAINQLEMWQAETWDPKTIDRELGWAQEIGMNCVRVYLHDLAWQQDPKGFKKRINEFLGIAKKHGIKAMFVFFDDCWNAEPKIGKQPEPKKGVHNSGWVQSPAKSVKETPESWGYLETYLKDVLSTFKNDDRILMWDLYNEPGNSGFNGKSMALLEKTFAWARSIRPSQPLTVALWYDNKTFNDFQLQHSDVITFHQYGNAGALENQIRDLRSKSKRPLICNEWMARTNKSMVATHLPIFKREGVGCLNWGLVSGKSNTIFPWGSKEGSEEPKVWFHDLFRPDGTPFDQSEIDLFKSFTR